MFPVKRDYKFGYKSGQRTFYGTIHRGVDLIIPSGTPLYMPKDGVIIGSYWGPQGGYRIEFSIAGQKHRFLHLRRAIAQPGASKEGAIIAYSGNSGLLTTGPHLHWDIYDNKWIDPLSIVWDNKDMTKEQEEKYKKEIRKLNTEIGRVTKERDNALKDKDEEIKAKQDNYDLWQYEVDRANKAEETLKQIQDLTKSYG